MTFISKRQISQSVHAEFTGRDEGGMGADHRAWCLRTTTVLSCYRKWVRIPVYVEEEQFHLNRPRSIYKYSNMAPRLSDQNCKLNFLSCFCLLKIPRRDLGTKKTPPNIDVCPESLRANIKIILEEARNQTEALNIASTCLRYPFISAAYANTESRESRRFTWENLKISRSVSKTL